jgi:heme/copper-type cytochrome/quinol oxidase subunit 4
LSCFLCGARVHSYVVAEYVVVFLLSVSVSCLSLSLVSSEKNFNNTSHLSTLSLFAFNKKSLSLFTNTSREHATQRHSGVIARRRTFPSANIFFISLLTSRRVLSRERVFPARGFTSDFCIILSKILLFFCSRENLVFARDATRVFVFVTSLCVFHFRLWEWKQSQSELILTRSRNIRHLAALQNRRYPRRRRLFYFLA